MPNVDYPRVITEDEEQLLGLEKRHRYTHLFHRVKTLRLLKSGKCSSLGEAAEALGYGWRQCQRWFAIYQREGSGALLISRVGERGPKELVSDEAFGELEGAMKRGEIATVAQAHRFLLERGVRYTHPESVGGLLRRRKVKLKTGRPRHEKADPKEQEAFKKRFRGELLLLLRRIGEEEREAGPSGKPLKVMAFDEARFGLINWHYRRYCPVGFRPPRIVRRRYEWSWLYAAVEPATGESFCSYMPGADDRCLETFFEGLSRTYPDQHLVVVLDSAPSHRSKRIALPENITLLKPPSYSPELNPVERWFLEFRRSLSNKIFESVELLQQALTRTLEPYWREPALLKRLTGYSWWVEAVESS